MKGRGGHTTTGTTSSNCQSRVSPDQFILWSSDYAARWCNSLDNTVYRYSVIANSWDNSTTGQSRRLHLDWGDGFKTACIALVDLILAAELEPAIPGRGTSIFAACCKRLNVRGTVPAAFSSLVLFGQLGHSSASHAVTLAILLTWQWY